MVLILLDAVLFERQSVIDIDDIQPFLNLEENYVCLFMSCLSLDSVLFVLCYDYVMLSLSVTTVYCRLYPLSLAFLSSLPLSLFFPPSCPAASISSRARGTFRHSLLLISKEMDRADVQLCR